VTVRTCALLVKQGRLDLAQLVLLESTNLSLEVRHAQPVHLTPAASEAPISAIVIEDILDQKVDPVLSVQLGPTRMRQDLNSA
jgi:hypothetical protein